MPTLPASLQWRFGDYTPADELLQLEGTPLAWIPSHGDLGVELLLSQFRGRPRIEAVLRALLAGVQDLDDGAWQVLTERWLDSALGAQLDGIGQVVGLPRAGWHDELYRRLLKAQILVLRSSGTWPDVFGILVALGVDLSTVSTAEEYPAAFRVALGAPLSELVGADVFALLERARAAATRLTLEFVVAPTADSLTWADGDAEQADTARGWAPDDATSGGVWADALSSTERA